MKDLKRGIRRDHRDRLKKKRKYYWSRYLTNVFVPPLTKKQLSKLVDTPKGCNNSCCMNKRRNKWNKAKEKLTIQERKFLESFKTEEVDNEYFPNED
jgi:hypothetical protein